ncbi:MAG: hypothetical protein CVU15_05475 [Betaproteobacteria bacterium HGW-Betaproteobacteria-1]|jgi:hypothetical protein|nr:MAG: hypothetical protein CVU15_05475 [Betaproteobacteria bacterium HGW-Betaproteobacteria-1]
MTPLQPQKKRSAGRPKENELLRELKVKTWFNAVAEASGKTAYELEKEFSPSYVDKGKFHKQRSRLWEKYRTGKVVPTMKETKGGRRPIALLVEEKYPGTLQWLTSPLWTLADPEAEITMDYLRTVYESFEPKMRALFIQEKPENRLFWRVPFSANKSLLEDIVSKESVTGFVGLLCLMRESVLLQEESFLRLIIQSLRKSKINVNAISNEIINLKKFVLKTFAK